MERLLTAQATTNGERVFDALDVLRMYLIHQQVFMDIRRSVAKKMQCRFQSLLRKGANSKCMLWTGAQQVARIFQLLSKSAVLNPYANPITHHKNLHVYMHASVCINEHTHIRMYMYMHTWAINKQTHNVYIYIYMYIYMSYKMYIEICMYE